MSIEGKNIAWGCRGRAPADWYALKFDQLVVRIASMCRTISVTLAMGAKPADAKRPPEAQRRPCCSPPGPASDFCSTASAGLRKCLKNVCHPVLSEFCTIREERHISSTLGSLGHRGIAWGGCAVFEFIQMFIVFWTLQKCNAGDSTFILVSPAQRRVPRIALPRHKKAAWNAIPCSLLGG